ncbi:glycosyltransferase family 39 protein [candidate division KSB1 bacterium]|nr:glycosyltransferase family 39 protein [candidate division KSB1 bacterium]
MIFMLVVAAFMIRLIYVSQLDARVWWVDETDYLALGQSIAAGNGYVNSQGQPTAFRPPGYPLFLAILSKVAINDAPSVRVVQAFVSSITVLLLSLLSLRIVGPVASLVSAGLAAGYPYFIYSTGTLFPITWFSLTLVASVTFLFIGLDNNRKWYIALAGFCMGLSILTRTSAAVLGLATLLWLLIILFKSPKKLLLTALVFGLTMTSVLFPWLLRNYHVFGTPVLSTNGGRNLWLGNNPKSTANSGSNIEMPQEFAQRIGMAGEIEADHLYSATALEYIKSDQNHYLWLAVQKGVALWRLDPSPTTEGYPRYKCLHSLISWISYAPILLLALTGFAISNRAGKKKMLLWLLFGLFFTLLHAVYISKVRFRLPLDYFLILMAGAAINSLVNKIAPVKKFTQRLFPEYTYE